MFSKKESVFYRVYQVRHRSMLAFMLLLMSILLWRVFDLMLIKRAFLLRQGEARTVRIVSIPAYRGMITDRHGAPLAVSTPVVSIWANPQELSLDIKKLKYLALFLKLPESVLRKKMGQAMGREFVYLRRGLQPDTAKKIKALGLQGIYFQREFRRFYPEADASSQLLGFTNVDDRGQEGLELAYDEWLTGLPGKKKVIKDRLGHVIADLEVLQKPKPGRNLMLSIDRRIQELAYRELKESVEKNKATWGSLVVLDVKTAEVLAVTNYPSFNPNTRRQVPPQLYRNRALIDLVEPGSVMKTFTVALALASGRYRADTVIDTSPGWITVNRKTLVDHHNYGPLTVAEIFQRSSNVGTTKIILSLGAKDLWQLLHDVGLGSKTATGFPGESAGVLVKHRVWSPLVSATLAFGYGLSMTPIQLAQAYMIFADQGQLKPISLIRINKILSGKKILSPKIAKETLRLLQEVIEKGSGKQAKVKNYTVAGKTGTARLLGANGYSENNHLASFVGIAPASHPRIVIAVLISDPKAGQYYAASVAAPIFSEVAHGVLRVLDVPPDNLATQDE